MSDDEEEPMYGLYGQLSLLREKHKGFVSIRGPILIGGRLMMILLRPRNDDPIPNVWNRKDCDDQR